MHATLICRARGFWGRSFDELSRLTGIAIRSEGVTGPTGPYLLQSFKDPESVDALKLMTDHEIGGYSTANLAWVPPPGTSSSSSAKSSPPPLTDGYVRFSGTISTQLPPDRLDVTRTGYAAWRTADRKATIFGRPLWDVDSYAYLALRVRSDGRSYMVNVQVDSMVAPTDLHQHRLFARRPGRWETVVVPWSGFVRTNHGYVVEPQTELIRTKVRSIGLGLTDRVPGPFAVCVARLWATNNPDEAEELGPQEFQDAEEQVAMDAAAAASIAAQQKQQQQSVTVNIPFDPRAATLPASPSPKSPPPDAGALKGKDGRPINWGAGRQAQS